MFLRIAGAQSTEQSGIKGAKRPFDPDIMTLAQKLLYTFSKQFDPVV